METSDTSEAASTSASAAGYGHACANCARAKCKCILRAGDTCERCHRLGKQCSPSSAIRKSAYRSREPANKAASSRRVQELEQKLNELASVVRSVQQSQPSQQQLAGAPSTSSGQATSSGATPTHSISMTDSTSPSSQVEHAGTAMASSMIDGLTAQEAREYLATFRTQHLQFFPLVYLSPTITPQQLQQERPFLWLCIRAICTKSVERQQSLGVQIREIMARQVIVEGERSIDLLLGLSAFLSWGRYFHRGKPEMALYTGISSALVSDLVIGIDLPLRETPTAGPSPFGGTRPGKFDIPVITNEDRRALLASYITNSFISSNVKFSASRWKPCVDEPIRILSENPECFGDQLLAGMARIAQVAQNTTGVLWPQQGESDKDSLPMLYIKPLISSLEQVKFNLSPELLQNHLILVYLYHTEALIYSIALMQHEPASTHQSTIFRRIEYLHHCLHAAKSAIDNYLALTPEQYAGMTMILMMLFGQGMQFIYRLCVLEDPGWDRDLARETVDTVKCLEQAAQRLEVASDLAASAGNDSAQRLFFKASSALRSSIPVWEAALSSSAQQPISTEAVSDFNMEEFVAGGPALMDFSDVMWFEDTFPSWQ